MKILVGPVIGKVTETTARILIEYDTAGQATITLSENGQNAKSVTQEVEARRPKIFCFSDLKPNTKYLVQVSPSGNEVKSGFRTMNTNVRNLRICWVSCNDASKNIKHAERNLWNNLAEEVALDKYDLIVHMGDQVYLDSDAWVGNKDNVYGRLKENIFDKYPKSEWPNHKEEIEEHIRDEYRRAWNFSKTAYVLANVPNIMNFDDHEVRNSWGYQPEDWDPNSDKFDYYYGQLCRNIFYEYQRSLRDENLNLKDISNIKEEYFTHRIGKIGFFFSELRADRTWHRTKDFDETKIMTQKQWDRLDYALNVEFKDAENFVFVSQSTVVFLTHGINKIFGSQSKDYFEQWVQHEDCQYKLLKKLFDWKFQPGFQNREVTIMSGDIHIGGHTDIYYKNKRAFKQFTSSSITNGLKQGYERITQYLGQTISEILNRGDFSYDHHDWYGRNNYGCTTFSDKNKSGQKVNTVECWSVVAKDYDSKDAEPILIKEKFDNNYFLKDTGSQCCNIF